MNQYKNFFLTEGAKHMYHPMDLPEVHNGNDLVNVFKKTVNFLKDQQVPLKIDGINVNPRLVTTERNTKEFALYSGSIIDAETNVTIDKLPQRFEKNPGRAEKGAVVLNIFNKAIGPGKQFLEKLGMWNNPNLVFFSDFVSTQKTNVVQYDKAYIAVHLIMKIVQKPGARAYTVEEVGYDKNALQGFVDVLNKVASQYNIEVFHQKVAKLDITPDLNAVLSEPFVIDNKTNPLGVWLKQAQQPSNKKITTIGTRDKTSGIYKPGKIIAGNNQALYLSFIQNGFRLSDLVEPSSLKTATDDIVFWHASRLLGKAILDSMGSELGKASTQEGVVINNPAVSPHMFKITGDFFIRNSTEGAFRKQPKPEESDEDQLNVNTDNSREPVKRKPYLYPPYYGMGEGQRLVSRPSTFNEMVDMVVGRERGNQKKVVVIYPGRFQPFHKAHAIVYNKLKQQFPQAHVFISTSDVTDPARSPFNFEEKQQMILASGVDPHAVKKVAQPYRAEEIIQQFSKDNTILIFAVGRKDMEGPNARFTFGLKRNGEPTYFQKFESLEKCEPLSKHAYITVLPTATFSLNGGGMKSASEIRSAFKAGDENTRKQIITGLYGKFNPTIYKIFNQKL